MSASNGVLLLVSMSVFEWFGVDGIPGRSRSLAGTENAWEGMSVVSWVMAVTCAVAILSVLLHLTQRSHGAKTNTALLLTALGAVTAVLVAYRVLIDLPGANAVVDQKLGAFLGLMFAIGIPLGGLDSLRAQRSRIREHRSKPHSEEREARPAFRWPRVRRAGS